MGEAEAPRSWPGVCSGEAERLLVGFQEQFGYQGQNPTMRQHCREITLLYLKERSQDDPKESLVCVELMMVNWGPPLHSWGEGEQRPRLQRGEAPKA